MQQAIELSAANVENGGGPFGAVIVRDGVVVATGVNRVTANNDPTAHAEVSAIRSACQKLGTFNLSGCVIYTSCEPCPMCLSAIYWARLEKIYFANTKEDAKAIDFADSFIYDEIAKPYSQRKVPFLNMMREDAYKVFESWIEKADKIKY
ncbi:MAG: nucleoside deaminase [Alistipes sp.]|nr:nucleoside deaminase [Candidatus Alistipes equi]